MNNLTKFNLRNENTRGSKPVASGQLVGEAQKVFKTKTLNYNKNTIINLE